MTPLAIPRRFNGPPNSANGGWFSGRVAQLVHEATRSAAEAAVTVRLHAPPPLEVTLALEGDGTSYRMSHGGTLLATAELAADLPAPPGGPVTFAEAAAVATAYEGLVEHPFPTCFSCGTERTDAMSLRPARLPGPGGAARADGAYAAAWTAAEVSVPVLWAALDCPGGWCAGIAGRPMVLGTMTAQLHRHPEPGEPWVVMAWPRGGGGRRFDSTTGLVGVGGDLLGRADAIWIAVNPASVQPR